MRNSTKHLGLAIVLLTLGAVASGANASDGLTPSLIECRAIANDADRLACFDGAVAGLAGKAIEEATIAAAPLSQEEMFGRDDLKDVQKEKKKQAKAKVNKSLASTVVEIATNKRGKYVVILENGQIWRQLTADTDKLRVPKNATGIAVTIKKKALGAHVLSLDTGKRSIRVERIK